MNDLVPRIFVVEDQVVLAMELEDQLRGMGYVVCGCAHQGAGAVDAIADAAPDLVILDVDLGRDPDGFEVAARIQERSDIPVLFLTAHSDGETARAASGASTYGFLVKPSSPEVLRTNIEAALRHARTHALLGAALQATADGLLVVDARGRVQLANPRFRSVWGIPEDTPDHAILATIRPLLEDPGQLEACIGDRCGVPTGRPELLALLDGRVIERTCRHQVHGGQVIGSVIGCRDVTEARLLEDAHRLLSTGLARLAGDELFAELARLLDVDAAFVSTLVPSADPPRLRVVAMCVDGQLVPPIEVALAGTPCEAVFATGAIRVLDGVQQRFPAATLLQSIGAEGYSSIALKSATGETIGTLAAASRTRLRRPDQIKAMLHLFAARAAAEMDRRRREATFRDLFELSPDAVLMTARDGRIRLANRRAEELFGYARDELVGGSVEMLVPADARERHVRHRQRIATDAPRPMGSRAEPMYAVRKDGTRFAVDISLSPIRVDDEALVVAAVRDVSDRVKADEERRAFEMQLRRTQKLQALGTLASGIAHDFNNLLTPILAHVDLARLQLGPEGALVHESLDAIGSAATRAAELVRQILAFSRGQQPRRARVDLGAVVREVTSLLRASLPANVHLDVRAGPVPDVVADAAQLHQVVMNLATNAWHAIEPASGTVRVAVETCVLDARAYARVRVEDDGRGMDEALLDRIFEPFFTTKGGGRGAGLGLSVVHGIVTDHGGRVVVTSAPGRGSTFDVYLPLAT